MSWVIAAGAAAVLWWSTPVAAQMEDARVVPRGMVRLYAGGLFGLADSRFGSPLDPEGTAEEPLSTPFPARLTSEIYAPLEILQTRVNQVLTATQGEGAAFQATPENFFLITESLQISADHRRVPFGLEVGVLPRISFAVEVPLVQQWLSVMRFGLETGSFGINPDPAHNRALLLEMDSAFAALGQGRFLPTATSPVGLVLQERVREATGGQELRLPTEPVPHVGIDGLEDVTALDTGPHRPGRPSWALGDVEASIRIQLVNTPGDLAPGSRGGAGLRSALEAGVRLPTGTRPTADYLVLPPPEEGLSGFVLGLHNDLFVSRRLGASASVRWQTMGSIDLPHRRWTPAEAFPPLAVEDTLRWSPGNRLSLLVAPRFRIVDEITLFARYGHLRGSGESYEFRADEAFEPITTRQRTAQAWGLGAAFSTLPAYHAGRTRVPFEAQVTFHNRFTGSGAATADRTVEMHARIYARLWGR